MKKLEGDTASSFKTIEGNANKSGAAVEQGLKRSTNALQSQTSIIAAQFQDIAVQLQGGGSPFTIALQQGTQLAAILGSAGGGLSGTIGALGAAFASIVSPVNLLTIGFIAAGGAAVQYFMGTESDAETAKQALERHKDVIDRIKQAYGEAAEAAFKYSVASADVLRFEAGQNASGRLDEAIAKSKEFLEAVGGFTRGGYRVDDQFNAYAGAIREFKQSVDDGKPAVDVLLQQIADLAASNPAAAAFLYELAAGLKTYAAAARDAAAAASLAKFDPGALARGAAQGKAYEALSGVYQLQAAGAGPTIQDPNVPIPGVNPARDLRSDFGVPKASRGGGGGRRREEFADFVKRLTEQTDQIRIQSEAMNDLGMSADEARIYSEGLTAAQRQGLEVTPKLKDQVAGLAEKYSAVKSAGAEAKEQQDAFNRSVADANAIARGALGGLISDLRRGADAGEALANVFDKIADKAINIALESLFPSAPGKDGKWGGLFGSLLGGFFADGGRPPMGKVSVVGERGPELWVPDTAGTIIPNGALGGGATNVWHIDARGADAGAVARLEAAMQRIDGTFERRVLATGRTNQLRSIRA